MSTAEHPWAPPDRPAGPSPSGPPGTHGPPDAPTGPPGAPSFAPSAPLGGQLPVDEVAAAPSSRRELLLTASLFVAAVLTGASSLMPWRDFGDRFGGVADETGWVRTDGSLGRGWVVVLLGVLLAVSGILIASGRARLGRILGVCTGTAMVLAAIAEWGLGLNAVRTGPGTGLWVLLLLGVLVVVLIGALSSEDD